MIDISDKANPVSTSVYRNVVGQYTSPTKVVSTSNYVYYFDGISSWHILDLSNPQKIIVVEKFRDVGEPMAAVDSYIYAFQHSDQNNRSTLQVIDVSNPIEPTKVAESFQFWPISDVDVWGSRMYAVSSGGRTYILDISQPMQPTLVSTINQGGGAVAVTADTLYEITDNGLMAIDVSDETGGAPNYLATIGSEELVKLLETMGVTYAENSNGELHRYFHLNMEDVAFANDCVFVMDPSQGLMIFKLPE